MSSSSLGHEQYPPKWEVFDRLAPDLDLGAVGFVVSAGEINRFGARYRLARALRSLELQGYSDSISTGYASLFRLLLVYSAFEFLLSAIGQPKRRASELLSEEDGLKLIAAVRDVDPEYKVVRFVRDRTANRVYRSALDRCIAGEHFDALCLVPAIRHLFAHGSLASSSGAGEARIMARLCDVLAESLFKIVDQQFEVRMAMIESSDDRSFDRS